MSTFSTTCARPDPLKRVNYPFGLVMGVDEFEQEQAYLIELARGHQRLLHGYGTVWGLGVTVPLAVNPPEVRVASGVAVAPAGMRICVPHEMCAKLDDWLLAQGSALAEVFGPPPFPLRLCVVLCYRECRTDVVPLPGEPCRREEETQAPSRIADSFDLKLCVHPEDFASPPLASPPLASPPSAAAGALCSCPAHSARTLGSEALAQLLRRVEIAAPGPFATRTEVEDEVRALLTLDLLASPPPAGPPLAVPGGMVRDYLQGMMRVWVVEVLPELLRRDGQASCGPSGDSCVLLAQLQLPVGADGRVAGGAAAVTVIEDGRPILLSAALLQDWLLAGGPLDRA